MKIGILITMYDKWEEASLLIDQIRSWEGDYYIGLTCNHPDGKKFAKKKGVNIFITPKDIKFEKRPWDENTFYFDQNVNFMLRIRIHHAIMQGCKEMTVYSGCDFIVHTHCDGWFMSEDKLNMLVETMATKNKAIAVRGTGLGDIYKPWTSNTAFGQVDDHFFIFERQFALDRAMWEYKPEDMLMRKHSVHGTLMNIFAVKGGFSNMWYYKKLEDLEDYSGKLSIDNEVKPCLYDPDYGLLHVHRGSLPFGWGEALQAYYIRWNMDTLLKPNLWLDFMEEHYRPNIKGEIRKRNEKLDRKLKLRLFPSRIVKKSRITYKELLLKRFKLSTLLHNIKQRVYMWAASKFFKEKDVVALYRDELHLHDLVGENWSDDWE